MKKYEYMVTSIFIKKADEMAKVLSDKFNQYGYDGCIPVTIYMVQKYVGHFPFSKWVNIKGFSDKEKAVALMSLLYR